MVTDVDFSTRSKVFNILIVEDDPPAAGCIETALKKRGCGVRAVRDRDEAIAALRETTYSLVLMDLYMPGCPANQFVIECRKLFPRTRIILMTASNQVREEADALGLRFFLRKPFTIEELLLQMFGAKN